MGTRLGSPSGRVFGETNPWGTENPGGHVVRITVNFSRIINGTVDVEKKGDIAITSWLDALADVALFCKHLYC